MTISATALPGNVPPAIRVDVAVPVGNVMTDVAVWRNDSAGRSLVRTQPAAGFDSRTVFDFESPYGQNVAYDWTVTHYDPDDNATALSEPFTSWPGLWTGSTAFGSVASNRLTLAGSTSSFREVTRSGVSAAWSEIRVEFMSLFGPDPLWLFFDVGAISFSTRDGEVVVGRAQVTTDGDLLNGTGVPADEPFRVVRTPSGFLLVGENSGEFPVTATVGSTLESISLYVYPNLDPTPSVLGAVTVESAAESFTIAETSSPVTLSPQDAWLIAPQSPALSFPLSRTNLDAARIAGQGKTVNASNTTVHRILGTSLPVTTTSGNRQGDVTSVDIETVTADERAALAALLAPDVPILFSFPPDWMLDIPYGFYQVGDVSVERIGPVATIRERLFTLPLTRVRSPLVDVDNPGWSYAGLASIFGSYTDVLAGYASYADLSVDSRVA